MYKSRIGSSLAGGLGQIGISVQVSVISSAVVNWISCTCEFRFYARVWWGFKGR